MESSLPPIPAWPPMWPSIGESIMHVCNRGDWGRYEGKIHEEVRDQIKTQFDRHYVRLMPSGSSAVEWALRVMGIRDGDGVAVAAFDYPGNIRAVEVCGGRPVLVDLAKDRPVMDLTSLAEIPAESIRGVIASHLFGIAAPVHGIAELCRDRHWFFVEDACQVPGMQIDGEAAGSFGDLTAISFGGSKPITTGTGGALLYEDEVIAKRVERLLDRPSDAMPLSALQAAALAPQLESLDAWVEHRWDRAKEYASVLPCCLGQDDSVLPSFYKLAIQFTDRQRRDRAVHEAQKREIPLGMPFRSAAAMSQRRVEKPVPLPHSQAFADSVAVLDHRMLMVRPDETEIWIETIRSFL